MTKQEAIKAAKTIMDYCESCVMCEKCVFCLNPEAAGYGYAVCFFRDNTLSPSFWDKFLEAKHGKI